MSTKLTPTIRAAHTVGTVKMCVVRGFVAGKLHLHAPLKCAFLLCAALACATLLFACGSGAQGTNANINENEEVPTLEVQDVQLNVAAQNAAANSENENANQNATQNTEEPAATAKSSAEDLRAKLDITEDYRTSFLHGEKPASAQKYIMLHDTEGNNNAASVISGWDSSGNMVAAHFVVNKDGSIYQCVPLDKITHHAGYGDTGNNAAFGITEDGRDDMAGTVPIGSAYADYGMNAYSVGIEIVHVGGSGDYPQAQLDALDALIAYIDAYYGFESEITDHKAWRSTNSDTSAEFATYLQNYKTTRHH